MPESRASDTIRPTAPAHLVEMVANKLELLPDSRDCVLWKSSPVLDSLSDFHPENTTLPRVHPAEPVVGGSRRPHVSGIGSRARQGIPRRIQLQLRRCAALRAIGFISILLRQIVHLQTFPLRGDGGGKAAVGR